MVHLKSVRRSRGFSLIELLAVMGIMAALALAATPWFFKVGQRNTLKSAAREIQSTLMAARIKAVKRNQPVSVVISSLGPPIEVTTIEPNPPAPTPPHVPVILQLPAKAAILYATPQTTGGTVTFGGDGRIANVVTPPPTPTAYEYVLEGPVGATSPNRVRIKAWPNGRVEVVTPTNWQ